MRVVARCIRLQLCRFLNRTSFQFGFVCTQTAAAAAWRRLQTLESIISIRNEFIKVLFMALPFMTCTATKEGHFKVNSFPYIIRIPALFQSILFHEIFTHVIT